MTANTNTAQLTDTFLKVVSSLFDKYLLFYPEERAKLSILHGQLKGKDRFLCNRKNMTGHLTASGLLLDRTRKSVLLVYHNFLELWLQPGGHLDPEEMPLDGAIREFVEETGINNVTCSGWHSDNPIPIDMDTHFIPPNVNKQEGEHYHHDFQYLLILTGNGEPSIKIEESEVSKHQWVDLDDLLAGDYDPRLKRVARKIQRLNS